MKTKRVSAIAVPALTLVLAGAIAFAGAEKLRRSEKAETERERAGIEPAEWRKIGTFELVASAALLVGLAVPIVGLVTAAAAAVVLTKDVVDRRGAAERGDGFPVLVGVTGSSILLLILRLRLRRTHR